MQRADWLLAIPIAIITIITVIGIVIVSAPEVRPIPEMYCPPYTDVQERFEDGSLVCISGDGDVLIFDPDTLTWRSPIASPEQVLLPN